MFDAFDVHFIVFQPKNIQSLLTGRDDGHNRVQIVLKKGNEDKLISIPRR